MKHSSSLWNHFFIYSQGLSRFKTYRKIDENHSDKEKRYNVIGLVERVLFVVYTERGNDNIRIISARRATPKEEKEYYENYDIR